MSAEEPTLQVVSSRVEGLSNDMQGMSLTVQGLSKDMQGMSLTVRGLSKDMQGMSLTVQGLSKDMQDVSRTLQDVWRLLGSMNRRFGERFDVVERQIVAVDARVTAGEARFMLAIGALKESIEARDFRLDDHGRRLTALEDKLP